MKKYYIIPFLVSLSLFLSAQTIWQVGPMRIYTQPSQVINLVNNGDIIEIDAGEYIGDVGVWSADNLTIRGVGGKAHIRANGNHAQGKAIWVITGDNYVIENIELSECVVPDNNGAGIRHEGTNLTLRHCYFHDNQNGILTTDNPASDILIEYSEFARNSHSTGTAHNIYINKINKFTLQYSYFHGADQGHNLKSRAAENYILFNRIMDEETGASSYLIDLPNAGIAYLVGNILQQGTAAPNWHAIAYGLEQPATYANNEFNFYHNTLVNERGNGYFFIFNQSTAPSVARVFNNLLAGAVTGISTGSVNVNLNDNLHYPNIADAGLESPTTHNYQLLANSPAINAGLNPSNQGGVVELDFHYIHPTNMENRPLDGSIDVGAYEYVDSVDPVANVDNSITITEVDGVNLTNHCMQIGRPFIEGEIADYPQVLVNGTPILTQANVKTRWPDGSVKHAILNFIIPSIPNHSTTTLTFQNQTNGHHTGSLSQAEMLAPAFNFDAVINLTNANNQTISASARQMLQNGDYRPWLTGEVATSIVLVDHSANRLYDMGYDNYRSFRPIFHAIFWHALNKVEVRYIGEIANTEVLQDMHYDVELLGGNNTPLTLYTQNDIVHHILSRWTKKFWIDGSQNPKLNVNHNLSYLSATTLLPNYNTSLVVPESIIATRYNEWLSKDRNLFDAGFWQKYMPSTGGRAEIGIYCRWTVRWLFTGDWRDYEIAFTSADLAAAWPYHFREGRTDRFFDFNQTTNAVGQIVTLPARPTLWAGKFENVPTQVNQADKVIPVGTAMPPETWNNGHGWVVENPHQPAPHYPQYLLTGDYWYLEEMQFLAAYGAMNSNHQYRGIPYEPWAGLSDQIRGEAWAFRARVEAAIASPDGSLEKAYLTEITNHAIAFFEGRQNLMGTTHSNGTLWTYARDHRSEGHGLDPNPLHYWYDTYSTTNDCSVGPITKEVTSPWMANFMMYALGRAEELGFEITTLRRWAMVHLVGQLTHLDYNPYLSAVYREPFIERSTCMYFQTWLDVYNGFCPEVINNSMTQFTNTVDDLEHGYANIARAAASFGTDIPNGVAAWDWISNAANPPHIAENPKWVLLPRNTVVPPLSTFAALDFKVQLQSIGVQLTWMPEYTQKVEQYIIEKATASTSFQSIATIQDEALPTYRFTDTKVQDATTYYYRLKIVFANGHSIYSNIEVVNTPFIEALHVFPNPVQKQLFIKGIRTPNGFLRLYNNQGTMVYEQVLQQEQELSLSVEVLPTGLYYLVWGSSQGKIVRKVVVKK